MTSSDRAGLSRREEQRLATRERLLSVAVAAFMNNGYAGTDIAEIVAAAAVSRGTFYFHFPTKEAVLAELRSREEARIHAKVSSVLEQLSLREALEAVVAGVIDAEGRLGSDVLRAICAVQFRPEVVDSDTAAGHPVFDVAHQAVQRAMPGESASIAAADRAYLFLIGVFGLLATSTGPTEDRARLADLLITTTCQGVERP